MASMSKPLVDVELLVVPDCPNAQAASGLLTEALHAAGLDEVTIRMSVIDSQEAADERQFVGSPTILINGLDPFAERDRPPGLTCRIYLGPAGPSGLPEGDRVRKALIEAANEGVEPS